MKRGNQISRLKLISVYAVTFYYAASITLGLTYNSLFLVYVGWNVIVYHEFAEQIWELAVEVDENENHIIYPFMKKVLTLVWNTDKLYLKRYVDARHVEMRHVKI